MTLAFFVDQVFWREGDTSSSDEAYTLFAAGFSQVIGSCRADRAPGAGTGPQTLLPAPARYSVSPAVLPRAVLALEARARTMARDPRADRLRRAALGHRASSGHRIVSQYVARICLELDRPIVPVIRQNLVPQLRFAQPRGKARHRGGGGRLVGIPVSTARSRANRSGRRGRDDEGLQSVSARTHNHVVSLITDEQFAELGTRRLPPGTAEAGRLLFVGRLSSEKGLSYLLQALARLKRQGMPVALDIVGSGPLERELPTTIASLDLTNDVSLHGHVAHGAPLFAFFARATALVVPSLSGEGLPQVITEALPVGTPVIATRVGGIPAFLSHEHTALFGDQGDVSGLADAIVRIQTDKELCAHLFEHGRTLMSKNTLQTTLSRIVAILEREVLHEPVRAHQGPPD